MKVLPVFLLLIIIAGCAPSSQSLHEKGLMEFYKGNYMGALGYYNQAAAADNHKNPQLKLNIGKTYFRMGAYAQAENYINEYIKLYPEEWDSSIWLGHTYGMTGRTSEALVRLKTAQDEYDSPVIHEARGDTYFVAGKYEKAIEEFKLYATMQKAFSGPGHYTLGVAYFRLGDYRKAHEAFQESAKALYNGMLYAYIGMTEEILGKSTAANDAYGRALAENVNPRDYRIRAALIRNDPETAIQLSEGYGYMGFDYSFTGKGMLVIHIYPNSPMAISGLKTGDLITRINDKTAKDMGFGKPELYFRTAKSIEPVNMTVIRDGATLSLATYAGVTKEMDTMTVQAEEAILNIPMKEKVEDLFKADDADGLKDYVTKHPDAVRYIPDSDVRLLFVGPKGLKVGDLIKYRQKGLSDVVLAAKVRSADQPYKEFSIDELMVLKKYDITDVLIAAMLDVTTQVNRDKKAAEQIRVQQTTVIHQTTVQQAASVNEDNAALTEAGKAMGNAVGREAGKKIFNLFISDLF